MVIRSIDLLCRRLQPVLDAIGDPKAAREAILALIENLYAEATPEAGELALACQMLTVLPDRPAKFWAVLPQLQHAIDHTWLQADDAAELRARIRIRWRAAEGEWTRAEDTESKWQSC